MFYICSDRRKRPVIQACVICFSFKILKWKVTSEKYYNFCSISDRVHFHCNQIDWRKVDISLLISIKHYKSNQIPMLYSTNHYYIYLLLVNIYKNIIYMIVKQFYIYILKNWKFWLNSVSKENQLLDECTIIRWLFP